MRPIDADALTEEIEKIRNIARDARANLVRYDVIGHVLKAVMEAPTVDVEPEPKWISIEDCFPYEVKAEKILVVFERKVGRIVEMARYMNGHLTLLAFEDPGGIITHWMPLPDPPKEERRCKNGNQTNPV